MARRQFLVGVRSAGALLALLIPQSALAYCRSMGCSTIDPARFCHLDEKGCDDNGRPLFWPTSCISFGVQEDGSRDDNISYETMRQIVETAFQTWISVDCGGGILPAVAIENYGSIECTKREYNTDQTNANVFMFRDGEWPYENQEHTLALTTVTINTETGEIYDVDVEVNSADHELTISDELVVADLSSIITHEVGHFLGLGHSKVDGSTMLEDYKPHFVTMRTLAPDDVAGICALYGEEAAERPSRCEPRHGFSRHCATNDTGCCAVHGTRPRSSGPLALFALGLGLIATLRRFGRFRQRAGA